MSRAPAFDVDPACAERDLARLVLGLMETLRQVMELQALRHLEAGSLDAEEEERVGQALFASRAAILDVAERFGLEEADLVLEIGEVVA
ncbi:MAG: gas vesicle protein K [Pseudomonadota bacterium]